MTICKQCSLELKGSEQAKKIACGEALLIVERLSGWFALSDEGLRLRCGDLTANEIRSIRAVLASIIGK